jgi:hypothetical protein
VDAIAVARGEVVEGVRIAGRRNHPMTGGERLLDDPAAKPAR